MYIERLSSLDRIWPDAATVLDRIQRLNPALNAFITILGAPAAAKPGPLHGLPYGVKDLFNVKGAPTTWGAKDFENRIIDDDAEVVMRLRNAAATRSWNRSLDGRASTIRATPASMWPSCRHGTAANGTLLAFVKG